jgi:DNA mismatch repair protein MutL
MGLALDPRPRVAGVREAASAAFAADPRPAPSQRDFGTAVAHLHGVYVLAAIADGLIVVDAHAAHERITYERLKAQLRAGSVPAQALLLPVTTAVPAAVADALDEHGALLARLGFALRQAGPGLVRIDAVPAVLGAADPAELVGALLPALRGAPVADDLWPLLERVLANTACRASVHAHRELRREEMDQLLADMATTPRIDQCNHGRPTWVRFSLADLDRWFARGR